MGCNLVMFFSKRIVKWLEEQHTCHLKAPCESGRNIAISDCPANTHVREGEIESYCRPTRQTVNRAIRIDSVDPLIEGVPDHDAAERISPQLLYRLDSIVQGC